MSKLRTNLSVLEQIFTMGFLFLYIYIPLLILPFNILHIISFVSIVLLLTKYPTTFIEILRHKNLLFFLISQLIIIVYVTLLSASTSQDFSTLYFSVSTVFEVIPCAIFISIFLLDKGIGLEKFYTLILSAGMIQVFFVFVTFLFPRFREWVISNSGSTGLEDVYQVVSNYRIYGLARGYTFAMPLFQGVCIIIAFAFGAYRSSKYYLLIPFYLVSIILNARIGVIALVISATVIMYYKFRRNPLKQFLNIAFFSVIVYLSMLFVQYKAEDSPELNSFFGWLNSGIDEIVGLWVDGEVRGNLAVLEDMWFAPSGLNILFGTGKNVFGIENNSSDIGYVINLYYGGLIFSILLYAAYLVLIMKACDKKMIEKRINLSLLIYLAIANLKGNVFVPSEIINGVLVLIVFSISLKVQTEKRGHWHRFHQS